MSSIALPQPSQVGSVSKVKTRLFPNYELDLTEIVELDVKAEFFQSDLGDDVELPTFNENEYVEELSLSKENEVEDVNPQENEIELGDSDEDEHTSDQNEFDNEDANVEFDISPASEDEMENIWFEDDVRLLQVGGERVVGGDLVHFLHLHHQQEYPYRTYDLCTSTIDSRTHDLCTSTTGSRTDNLCISITNGEWIYISSIRPRNKIEPTQASQFITKTIQAHFSGPIHRFSNFLMDVQDLLYDMFMKNHRFTKRSDELRTRSGWTTIARANFKHLRRNAEKETQLKRPPKFQELFDQTHKKKGTNNYISEKAREVAVTSGAPKKGHVYGFGHSLGTARVISSCSSSVSHATSPFTTPAAPGGSSSATPTMTLAQFREIVNEIVSQNISHIVSQTVSQMLAQLGLLGDRAPPAQQPQGQVGTIGRQSFDKTWPATAARLSRCNSKIANRSLF
ncbi:hypothetical protein Taro_001321 [Colocasia esculenta]|uniref:Uncharacterized protein n=1 Tax=Colocasia esculenta TaxID=4460 RepID=A0A843T9K6_COLES|nr:hypothetical protein [Colocasia esculenta]